MNRVSPLPSTVSKDLNSSQDSADTEDRSNHAGDSGSENFYSCASQASTQPSLTESEVDALTLSPLPDTSCNRGGGRPMGFLRKLLPESRFSQGELSNDTKIT